MRPTVVLAYANLDDATIEREVLGAAGADIVAVDALDSARGQEVAAAASALMVTVQPVPASLLRLMDRCRIVCRVGTGVDAIDVPTATARGIWVTNVPDYAVDEVSTHALALMLALHRNLRGHLAAAAAGDWRYQAVSPIRRFRDLTLGILGCGRIGSAMARKGRGLGLRVIACDPYIPRDSITGVGAEPVDFETLLRESDFLSLHVPLADTTRRLFDGSALALMKPTAYLINTARGEVVDTDALLAAVETGRLAGAGLDVLPTEPPAADDPLLHDPRILVTPHVAWASEESARDVRQRGAEDVARVLRGQLPRTPVNEVDAACAAAGERV